MLVGVATPFPHNVSTLVSMRRPVTIDEASRRAVLEDVQDSVRRLPGTERWMKRAVVGFPAEAIVETASAWRASMIILGIGRHGRLHRFFTGETAVAVMRHARIPVCSPRMAHSPSRMFARSATRRRARATSSTCTEPGRVRSSRQSRRSFVAEPNGVSSM
jgi:hypothetical protein